MQPQPKEEPKIEEVSDETDVQKLYEVMMGQSQEHETPAKQVENGIKTVMFF